MKTYRALRYKNDNGFTLIELLVVILIIAILAAVGIVALLSALNSGRKSSATTVLRNGITAVRAWQSSQGQTDFTGITSTVMNSAEPDIEWSAGSVEATAGANSISIVLNSNGLLYLASKSEKNVCYYVVFFPNPSSGLKSTMYSSAAGATCSGVAAIAVPGSSYSSTTKAGWNN